jgi:heme exporter protein D
MSEFFAMGGYGGYIWGAYGVTFALLAIELWMLMKRKRETKT